MNSVSYCISFLSYSSDHQPSKDYMTSCRIFDCTIWFKDIWMGNEGLDIIEYDKQPKNLSRELKETQKQHQVAINHGFTNTIHGVLLKWERYWHTSEQ